MGAITRNSSVRDGRRGSRLPVVAALAVAAVLPLLQPLPATATTTVTGSATRQSYIAFTGDTTLNTFPCGNPLGCGASFAGRWEGHAAGVHGPSPYEVEWTTGASGVTLTAGVRYFENCLVDPTGLAQGHAHGTGEAHIGGATVVGRYWPLPNDLPRAVTGVHLYFDYQWNRFGNSALVSLDDSTRLILDVDGLGQRQVILGTQAALVAFTARPSPLGAPTCATPTVVQATVAGVVPLVDQPPSIPPV